MSIRRLLNWLGVMSVRVADKTIAFAEGVIGQRTFPEEADINSLIEFYRLSSSETIFTGRAIEDCDIYTADNLSYMLQEELNNEDALFIYYKVDGRIVARGTVDFMRWRRVRHMASLGLGVLKEFWGLGIGTEAMSYMISVAPQIVPEVTHIELNVFEFNTRAMTLYERLGFRTVAV